MRRGAQNAERRAPNASAVRAEPLLKVGDLRVAFLGEGEPVLALAGVSFQVGRREVVCLVGESGCGKTLTALSIMGILPVPPARVEAGEILFQGRDLLALQEEEFQRVRGKEISMIFQEPMTSLNPVFTVGHQIEEAILIHEDVTRDEAERRVVQLLSDVGIPGPEERRHAYPHQLSGGQRQRVMIAMALACDPTLLIADEPTTALDVTIQAQILRLFRDLQERRGMSLLYITHDLGVVAQLAHRIYVMYAGLIVEEARARALFGAPMHPYTRGLMASLPSRARRGERLHTIAGNVPDPAHRPTGCPFHPRCPLVTPRCRIEFPEMCDFGQGQKARCPVVHGSWR
jgi:oligopeptide/dipeptide ABC transporter ATP-binding protein